MEKSSSVVIPTGDDTMRVNSHFYLIGMDTPDGENDSPSSEVITNDYKFLKIVGGIFVFLLVCSACIVIGYHIPRGNGINPGYACMHQGHSSNQKDVVEDSLLSQFQSEMAELEKLGCKPVGEVLKIKDILSPEDELLDEDFYHKQIVVNHCVKTVSFCNSGRQCVPAEMKRRDFEVIYVKDGKTHRAKRHYYEHAKCNCE